MAKSIKEVKEEVEKVEEKVKAELLEVKNGVHAIFHKFGYTEFIDGFAEIEKKVADELKKLGLIK